jgi:hypothetical protein
MSFNSEGKLIFLKEAEIKLNALYSAEEDWDKKTFSYWLLLTLWIEAPEPKY